jgi:hypothetical protein
MWNRCAKAHEISSLHEIDGIGVQDFFYRMEWRWPGAKDFFYRSAVCLYGHETNICRVHFSPHAVLLA